MDHPEVDMEALRAALSKLQPHVQDVIGRFYERLLARRPDFAPYFEHTDWQRQRRMLLGSLVMALEAEEEPDEVRETIRAYGRRHDPYHLTDADYDVFGATLKETLQEALAADWSPTVDEAWDHVFAHLVDSMRTHNGPKLV
jgi:hemoglobin-like flavoprotein